MSLKERALIDTIFRVMRMLAAGVHVAFPSVKIKVAIEWPDEKSVTNSTPIPEFSN